MRSPLVRLTLAIVFSTVCVLVVIDSLASGRWQLNLVTGLFIAATGVIWVWVIAENVTDKVVRVIERNDGAIISELHADHEPMADSPNSPLASGIDGHAALHALRLPPNSYRQ